MEELEEKLKVVRRNIISHTKQASFPCPFEHDINKKPLIPLYLDNFATAPAYLPIERYITTRVLPYLSNTHTQTSFCGAQTNSFFTQARKTISESLKLNSKLHTLFFYNNNSTSCANLLARKFSSFVSGQKRFVYICPFAHHSNILPWSKNGFELQFLPLNPKTFFVCLNILKEKIVKNKRANKEALHVVSLSAASNLTGHYLDVEEQRQINKLVHELGGLVVWDFASAAPYIDIDFNGNANSNADACFLSPHKLLGGVNTPGVLVLRKTLLSRGTDSLLDNVGGGTVFWVKESGCVFKKGLVEREEGGSPDVVGAVRASLAFELKDNIKDSSQSDQEQRFKRNAILLLEEQIMEKVFARLVSIENVVILGDLTAKHRLSVISFLVRAPGSSSKFLHYNFVCSLLNDIFGIQCRGGCMCAGPYAQKLLGMTEDAIDLFEKTILRSPKCNELLRPGFTRLCFPFYLDENQTDYIVRALNFVATHGYKLLPLYRFDTVTGLFHHKKTVTKSLFKVWLKDCDLFPSSSNQSNETVLSTGLNPSYFEENLNRAYRLVGRDFLKKYVKKESVLVQHDVFEVDEETLPQVLWFLLPHEAKNLINGVQLQDQRANQSKVTATESSERRLNPSDTESETLCSNGVCFQPRQKEEDFIFENEILHYPKQNGLPKLKIPKKKLKIPKAILKHVGKAIEQWKLIKDGDRLLLGLSGGKDSLALLHVLLHFQKVAPIKFYIACCTIDPLTTSFDPRPLIPYVQSLGVEYFYVKNPIFENAKRAKQNPSSICSFCARFKRGILYTTCKSHGFNKLVLAQHLDDSAETLLMSLMHNGQLRAMKTIYETRETIKVSDEYFSKLEDTVCEAIRVKQGQNIEVIRPLCYVREKDLKSFSYSAGLPVIADNCPACFEDPKERRRMKKLLAREEGYNSNIFNNIRRAVSPLMSPDILLHLQKFNETMWNGKSVTH
eukprot:maker-scaffold_4-snap-gene-5.61-mRNA-1 protein AED:0.01 eAED:0.01 QI:0/0/0/1/0/0/2/0/955